MVDASTFDTEYFAKLMRDEVRGVAEERYEGTEHAQLGKAFQFWVIKAISPKLSPEQIESARTVCESKGGPGDENIDGAWMDETTFYIMQSKYSEPNVPEDSDDSFKPATFAAEPAEQVWTGFESLLKHRSDRSQNQNQKLIDVAKIYDDALSKRLRIELAIAVSGKPRKSLIRKVEEINQTFDKNRIDFLRHHCGIFDMDELNRIVSNNYAPPPEVVYLETTDQYVLRNPDKKSIYALSATVSAKELVRIRHDEKLHIYHSNFRFMLRGGVAAPKIRSTIGNDFERRNFWRYNNGITICCDSILPNPETSSEPHSWQIKGFQVVNGLQTIEALFEYEKKQELLKGVNIPVRVIPTAVVAPSASTVNGKSLEESIAEYSNSQTPITARDLRANDPVQRLIEHELLEIYQMKYIRKVGDTSGQGQPSRKVVKNDQAAQAALAFWYGRSQDAKAKKKLLFEKSSSATPGYYDQLFTDDTSAEYILMPHILWQTQRPLLKKIKKNKAKKGLRRALDLFATAIVGDVFQGMTGIGPGPVRTQEAKDKMKQVIKKAGVLTEKERPELWNPIFNDLTLVVERRREEQAKGEEVDPSDISLRNVTVKMDYADEELRDTIRALPSVKTLPTKLRRSLGV